MKKIYMCILIAFTTVFLSACGKSEAVKNAEAAITAIGTVDYDSKEKIEEAEKLYGILTDSEKEKVENRIDLVNAREEFNNLPPVFNDAEVAALFALHTLKEELKNPDSLVLSDISGGVSEYDSYVFQISYSAQNSFGGNSSDVFYIEVSRTEEGFAVQKYGSPNLFDEQNQYYTSLLYADISPKAQFNAEYLYEYIDDVWNYIE